MKRWTTPRAFKKETKFNENDHYDYQEAVVSEGAKKVPCNLYKPEKIWFDTRFTIGGEIEKAGYLNEEDALFVEDSRSPLMFDEYQAKRVYVVAQERVEFSSTTGEKKSIFTLQRYRPEVYRKLVNDGNFNTMNHEVLHDPIKYVESITGEEMVEEVEKPRRGRPKKVETTEEN